MAVKMRKWSPWPPSSAAGTRKFQVAVKPVKLDGLPEYGGAAAVDGDSDTTQKFLSIEIKWKGEPKLFPLMTSFQSRPKKELSSRKIMGKGLGFVHWDDEEDKWFVNTCRFSIGSDHNNDHKFGAWEIGFNALCSEKMDPKAKTAVIGRVRMNLSDFFWKTGKSSFEHKLPMSLQINGITREASLTVQFNFVEIRDSQDTVAITRGESIKSIEQKGLLSTSEHKNVKARRRSSSQDESDESRPFEAQTSLTNNSSKPSLVSDKKEGGLWFSWKSRRFSFKRAKTKEDTKFDETTEDRSNKNKIDADPMSSLEKDDPTKPCTVSNYQDNNREGSWEEKELISRDGQVNLKASIFFASFDQRSHKAAGESACTALVAVISHWLHSNPNSTPDRSQLDNLILSGSAEWRKLCEDTAYVVNFPNKHFDLETVLRADIRPVSISHDKSFVGFFGAEKFESLKGVMSFDDIWNEINNINIDGDDEFTSRIYIVSWNDHFFVLKVEPEAYYIIDTLGERLFEGCNQAYILRFDNKTLMRKHADKEKYEGDNTKEENEVICSGKECCREFIKRFLAAIPLKELEEEEKKKGVPYFSLHHRLQIEFNYSYLSSSSSSFSSSLTSSPFSSINTSASSPL